MRRIVTVAFALASLAAPLAAQSHPDFSGTWTMDPKSSTGDMLPQTATLILTQSATTLTFDNTITSQMGEQKTKTTINLDTVPARNTVTVQGMTLELTATTAWEGTTLVVTTRADISGQPLEQIDRFTLDADGKTLRVKRNVAIAGQTVAMMLVLNKQ
jgi:hypothetical protein